MTLDHIKNLYSRQINNKNNLLYSGLIALFTVSLTFMQVSDAYAVPCELVEVYEGGAVALYDCGEYGRVLVAKGATVTP
ncbi:MAG: hypothetical protein ACXIT9_03850 [Nitritalea sp.]